MIKQLIVFALITGSCFQQALAWGPQGHAIVGKLALHFMNKDTRESVLKLLGNIPVDTAANWMDIMKSNAGYDFMRPWHYLDFAEGKT